ncbi:hypothetical protein [Gorillibacterium sp. sgz5001074]|uniref:hypothetical protein n=1 Tax=Gorillibacterium sp. sgz5001074 TaxID=3446695 RepID=UPI003F67FA87
MKSHNCCGDKEACDIPVELPEDYMDTLYGIYVKECKEQGKEPLTKNEWIATITG